VKFGQVIPIYDWLGSLGSLSYISECDLVPLSDCLASINVSTHFGVVVSSGWGGLVVINDVRKNRRFSFSQPRSN
jgi:hypothetical protein